MDYDYAQRSIRCCPECGIEGYVVDTRVSRSGCIRRRRECPYCEKRWSTIEMPFNFVRGKKMTENGYIEQIKQDCDMAIARLKDIEYSEGGSR